VPIEHPDPSRRLFGRKLLWIGGVIFLAVILTPLILLAADWPFTRDAISRALQEASGRPVEIGSFTRTYFPPGCRAEGVRFMHLHHPGAPPLITIDRLTIQGSFTGMLTSPKRLTAVHIVGMQIKIPPKSHQRKAGHERRRRDEWEVRLAAGSTQIR
jgi:hypothetical protein